MIYDKLLGRIVQYRRRDIWHLATIRKVLAMTPKEKAARGITRTVRLLGNFPGLWQRTIEQTPGGRCQWGKTLFVADGQADHYVILNSIRAVKLGSALSRIIHSDPQRVWGLHMEPEEYIQKLAYNCPEEHQLVSRFYTSSASLLSLGGIYRKSPPFVHLHLGRSWDFLSRVKEPPKKVTLGIITSDLNDLDGQKQRLRFLEMLDASDLDYALWGRGDSLRRFRNYRGFVRSKWEAHAMCRYSIVLENSVSPWYWSEKIADAMLAYSFPLYHGCPNLSEFFPELSFVPINIFDPGVIHDIKAAIAGNAYNFGLFSLLEARSRLLQQHNIYAFLDKELDS